MMRISKILFTLLFLFGIQMAEVEGQEREFLIQNMSVGGFGGPDFHLLSIDGEGVAAFGGRGAALFGDLFILGGYGYGTDQSVSIKGDEFELGEGGLWIGSLIYPDKLLHGGVHLHLGWMDAQNQTNNASDRNDNRFFVLNPTVQLQVNITTWMRAGIHLGYRKAFSQDTEDLITESDVSGVNSLITLSFGGF